MDPEYHQASVSTEHINVPVRKIHEKQDAVYHGEAQGHEGIDTSKSQTVYNLLSKQSVFSREVASQYSLNATSFLNSFTQAVSEPAQNRRYESPRF